MTTTERDEPEGRRPPPAPAKAARFDFTPSTFRDWVLDRPDARFRPEAGRYHLYVSHACPFAQRTLIVRALKGLERVIDVTATHHYLDENVGWAFSPDPEPLYGLPRLRELYTRASAGYAGRATVPVLWCKRERTIVNNESSEIVRMFNGTFNALAERPELDLYPEPLRPDIDRWNERLYWAVNVGAYRVAFAATQETHDEAVRDFFDALDELEAHLASHRYLVGDQPTEADWRLFPALLRFEWAYHGLFRCNLRRLVDYPNLFAYVRELYQWPGVAPTVNEHHIRHGYYRSMRKLNPTGIVPAGPLVDFSAPHGRG